ncbi:MAG: dihydroorotate dehydrogenase [Candidatus Dormibacteria bacterium]
MTADLSVDLGRGLRLDNPVMAASGTFGYGIEYEGLVEVTRLGAVVSKGTTLRARPGNPPPRIAETPSGMLNSIGLQNGGVDHVIAEYCPLWATWKTPVLVNIAGESLDEYAELARRLDSVPGVAGIELNISCPNVQTGLHFGVDATLAEAVTRTVRDQTSLHVMVKLSPNVTDIAEIARAVEAGGADSISAINTLVGMRIDVNARRPVLAMTTGGLSGPAIRPVALHLAWRAASAVSIPVVGIGGIATASDALEFLLAGCRAVQVGSVTFAEPAAMRSVIDGITAYLDRIGCRRLAELPALNTITAGVAG